VKEAQVFGETLHLLVEDPERDLPRLRATLLAEGFADAQLRPITPSLEDVFVTLLRDKERKISNRR
jgi:ABC-2 type transport system ATP-binding protein